MANGINFGSTSISTVKLGNSQVDKIYLGNTLVWQPTHYLSLSGGTDYLDCSHTGMLYMQVQIIGTFRQPTTSGYIFDDRPSPTRYATKSNDGTGTFSGGIIKWNGVTQTNMNTVPFNTQGTLLLDFQANANTTSFKFGTTMPMDIYNIKFFDAGLTLMCHIDMNTQTLTDQTGGGLTANLVGTGWAWK
jgi:hypothetical protein